MLLIDPKFAHNVGGALRACGVFGAHRLAWTGDRVPSPSAWPAGARLPREERMKLYSKVDLLHARFADEELGSAERIGTANGYTPVCVEVLASSEPLTTFEHPEHALYIFGPEDASIPGVVRARSHRFVTIPTAVRTPLNPAAAVNVVLYDRFAKIGREAASREPLSERSLV